MKSWVEKVVKFLKEKKIFSLAFLGLIVGLCEPKIDSQIWWLKFTIIGVCLNVFYSVLKDTFSKKISFKEFYFLVLSFFYGWFFVSASWVANSALVNGLPSYFVVGYFLIRVFFPVVLAGVKSIPFYFLWKYQKGQNNVWKAILFAVVFVLSEMFLTFVWQGWPYEYMAYNWFEVKSMIQLVSLPFISVFDLSLVTMLLILSFRFINFKNKSIRPAFLAFFLPFVVTISFGFVRLSGYEKYDVSKSDLKLDFYLFQGNAPSYIKYTPKVIDQRKTDLINMQSTISLDENSDRIPVFTFYESALQYYIGGSKLHIEEIQKIIPKNGYLISGHLASFGYIDHKTDDFERKFFNSLSTFDSNGNIIHTYDKKRLVAFGEYLPWFLKIFVPENGEGSGFSNGENRDELFLKDRLFFLPKICHEITFPFWNFKFWKKKDDVEKFAILNVLNEGWFADKVLDKHYIISTFQAVENNKPLLRIANTGLTGAIDKYGFSMDGISNGEKKKYLNKNISGILKISL
ncbi:MAG: apolipoprotein N-acyltransferase [Alphaproteobacteria bacterium]|nr:apolipoprotein N-acyltransferase [Alphaproteobacteria bacterium]